MLEKFISFVYVQRNNFLKFTTVTQHGDRGWNRTNVPIYITPSLPTQPMKICTTPLARDNIPYSLGTVAWALLCPTRIRTVKEVWHEAYGFQSLSEKTRMSKGSTFSVRYFKTLSVGPARVWTHNLPPGRPVLIQPS